MSDEKQATGPQAPELTPAQVQAQRKESMDRLRNELRQQFIVSAYIEKVLAGLEALMVIDNVLTEPDKDVLKNQIVQVVSKNVQICQVQTMQTLAQFFGAKPHEQNTPSELRVDKGDGKKPEMASEPESTEKEKPDENQN